MTPPHLPPTRFKTLRKGWQVEIGRCQWINLRVLQVYVSSGVGIGRPGYKEKINLRADSRWCHTVQNKPKLLCDICPWTFISELHVRVKWINIRGSDVFHEDKNASLGVLKKQSLHQGSVVIEWAWHTHTHTTNTATNPSPLVPLTVELPLMHDNTS